MNTSILALVHSGASFLLLLATLFMIFEIALLKWRTRSRKPAPTSRSSADTSKERPMVSNELCGISLGDLPDWSRPWMQRKEDGSGPDPSGMPDRADR